MTGLPLAVINKEQSKAGSSITLPLAAPLMAGGAWNSTIVGGWRHVERANELVAAVQRPPTGIGRELL